MKNDKKCENCSDCKKYQEKAFELEVDEELQQEKLALWWKKYGWLVYVAVIAILATTAASVLYHNYKIKLRLSESDAFETALLQAYSGKEDEAVASFEKLAKSGKTSYRILALMNLSDIQMLQGKKEDALKSLKEILDTTSKKDPLYLTTSLAYVGYQLDTEEPDKLLKILNPALENDAFQGLATELAVPLLHKTKNKAKADELIQKAIQNPATSAGSKARLNTLRGA